MNQQQLNEIIVKHRKWLKDETGGQKANLRGANLRKADLRGADLRGALFDQLIIFNAGKHQAVFNKQDQMLCIGCEYHPLNHWFENYVEIGSKHNYTEKETEECGVIIKVLRQIMSL